MNDSSSPRETRATKPTGAITYTVERGANMFPSFIMSDKASVRVLDGELAIFQQFVGHDGVAVNVGGRNRVLARAEWRALPVYER